MSKIYKRTLPPLYICALLLTVWVFVSADLQAQISVRIDQSRSTADAASLIEVRWNSQDQQSWQATHDDRLEIIGLKANLRSENLLRGNTNSSSYAFDFVQPLPVEFFIKIDYLEPEEQIYLWDTELQKIIFEISSTSKSRFLTPVFDPSSTVLVWKGRDTLRYQSRFSIVNIYYHANSERSQMDIGFGAAMPCHPNTACKQDSMLQLIAGSAVRIRLVMEEGIGWCTGSFLNNTRNDKTPYLLTAFHCQFNVTPLYDMWRFDFEYSSATCANPLTEPAVFSLTGCELRAAGQGSDFLLVELENRIPINRPVTFAGWDHDDTLIPDTTILIHHPRADIRKVSTCSIAPVIHPNQIGWSEGYTTPGHHHLRLKFTEGGHEAGSSGAPFFNDEGYLVGQLHGGTAGCEATNNAFIGRFSRSWNSGAAPQDRLQDWLDPDATGITRLACLENIGSSEAVDIQGMIVDPFGRPVKNAVVKVTGSLDVTFNTNEDGTFLLSGVNRNGSYTITPTKADNPTNGLNALDLVAIQKHLLGKEIFEHQWQYIAADATNSSGITVGDIVMLLRLLLGKITLLPTSHSWRFDPPQIVVEVLPPGEPVIVQMTGIKIGDVNGTADPQK